MTNLIDRVKLHERFMPHPYRCTAGKLTIGYGRNLEDVGLSEQEAMVLLINDLNRSYEECKRSFKWFKELDKIRKEVVVEMCFNLGLTRLLGFKKMSIAINNKDYETAAREMLDSLWAKQVGDRATVLADAMLTGLWKADEIVSPTGYL